MAAPESTSAPVSKIKVYLRPHARFGNALAHMLPVSGAATLAELQAAVLEVLKVEEVEDAAATIQSFKLRYLDHEGDSLVLFREADYTQALNTTPVGGVLRIWVARGRGRGCKGPHHRHGHGHEHGHRHGPPGHGHGPRGHGPRGYGPHGHGHGSHTHGPHGHGHHGGRGSGRGCGLGFGPGSEDGGHLAFGPGLDTPTAACLFGAEAMPNMEWHEDGEKDIAVAAAAQSIAPCAEGDAASEAKEDGAFSTTKPKIPQRAMNAEQRARRVAAKHTFRERRKMIKQMLQKHREDFRAAKRAARSGRRGLNQHVQVLEAGLATAAQVTAGYLDDLRRAAEDGELPRPFSGGRAGRRGGPNAQRHVSGPFGPQYPLENDATAEDSAGAGTPVDPAATDDTSQPREPRVVREPRAMRLPRAPRGRRNGHGYPLPYPIYAEMPVAAETVAETQETTDAPAAASAELDVAQEQILAAEIAKLAHLEPSPAPLEPLPAPRVVDVAEAEEENGSVLPTMVAVVNDVFDAAVEAVDMGEGASDASGDTADALLDDVADGSMSDESFEEIAYPVDDVSTSEDSEEQGDQDLAREVRVTEDGKSATLVLRDGREAEGNFTEQLRELRGMGFADRHLNVQLLTELDGDLNAVLDALFEAEGARAD